MAGIMKYELGKFKKSTALGIMHKSNHVSQVISISHEELKNCLNLIPEVDEYCQMITISENNYDSWKPYCLKENEILDDFEVFHLEKEIPRLNDILPNSNDWYKVVLKKNTGDYVVRTFIEYKYGERNQKMLTTLSNDNRWFIYKSNVVTITRSFWENCRTKFNRLFPEE